MTVAADVLALWRVDLYRLLALAFDYPSRECAAVVEELLMDLVPPGTEHPAVPVPRALPALAATWSWTRAPQYRADYHRLFDTQASVGATEGAWRRTDRGAVMRDVTAFYHAFGFAAAAGAGQPDGIRQQLAFMAVLGFKEWVAFQRGWTERAEVAREAQMHFLADHLAGWSPAFAQRLAAAATGSVYALLAELLDEWVREDALRLGATTSAAEAPPEASVDALGGGCPAAGTP